MTLQQLHYFRVLAKIQHYTKAAEILLIAQPSLSYSISQLEKELNTQLFERNGRKVKLSYAGERFLEYVEKSLDTLEEGTKMLKTLADSSIGEVSLGYIYSVSSKFIPEMIKKFYEDDSNKSIKFSLVQNLNEQLLRDLKSNKIDLAICPKPEKGFKYAKIFNQPLYLIIPKKHHFSQKKCIAISDIIDEPFVALSRSSSLRDIVDDIFAKSDFSPNIVFEAEECNAVISFVSLNFGISIVPEIPSMHKHVNTVKICDLPLKREIYLCWSDDKYLSPAAIKTRDFIIENFTTGD
jgi:DNA-binding transcriptional LysR family regulator